MSETTHGTAASGPHAEDHDGGVRHAAGPADAHADAGDVHGAHGPAEALGPIDWRAWGAGILGIAAGLAVAGALFLSTRT